MRFTANGPAIPDDLLLARDQGRVVFFCGSGVSRAKAGLADFFELASSVTDKLGVQDDSPVTKLIDAAQLITEHTGVESVVSADRIFGLLEREFLTKDIYEAVASALTPQSEDVDLSAHQTMLKLATTSDGVMRLVTTNFDLLFDQCSPELETYTFPKLPNLVHPDEFNGVVYLHGKLDSTGKGAENDFVLSSSEFGEAYLASGWATNFVKSILEKYVVVFVGYSADDPPIQYLLEALKKTSQSLNDIYAFQIGNEVEANKKWIHKGVKAIPFEQFDAMWETLNLWSIRAENPTLWYQEVLEKAKDGPQSLKRFERGQVAHMASNIEGVKVIANSETLLPASWLHVFDPKLRYKTPRDSIDPFALYALDTDPIPKRIDGNDYWSQREIPNGVWNAFGTSNYDQKTSNDNQFSSFWGHGIYLPQQSILPPRLNGMASWLSKIADQPEAIRWVVQQPNLHPWIKLVLRSDLFLGRRQLDSDVYDAWKYLLEFFENKGRDSFREWSSLRSEISTSGWSNRIVRLFEEYSKPYIEVLLPYNSEFSFTKPNVRKEVRYPEGPQGLSVPDEWLAQVAKIVRRNLEVAKELEAEVGGRILDSSQSLSDSGGGRHPRGLFSWLCLYKDLLVRIAELSPEAVQKELALCPTNDGKIFDKLRCWALGRANLVPSSQLRSTLDAISNSAFWKFEYQNDLLLSICERWNCLNDETKDYLEERILRGPEKRETEQYQPYFERSAYQILERVEWLGSQDCEFKEHSYDFISELKLYLQKWDSSIAENAIRNGGPQAGIVTTDEDCTELFDVPLSELLSTAQAMAGRKFGHLVEANPFLGLSNQRPVRAFAALRLSYKLGEVPAWAWDTFLSTNARAEDPSRLMTFIASNIVLIPASDLQDIVRPVCYWLRMTGAKIAQHNHGIFTKLIDVISNVLTQYPQTINSAAHHDDEAPDWVTETINSPVGYFVDVLFEDPCLGSGGLPECWINVAEKLLGLPYPLRQYAIVSFSMRLSWLFSKDSKWITENLLSVLELQAHDRDAFWDGTIIKGISGFDLFYALKPNLFKTCSVNGAENRGRLEGLVNLVLSAWKLVDEDTGEKLVSNTELRGVLLKSNDSFRCQFLRRFKFDENDNWLSDIETLLTEVWPKQMIARSTEVSGCLCEIAFESESDFEKVSQLILPLLTRFERLCYLDLDKSELIEKHPFEVLSIIFSVLPEDVRIWPYNTGECLEKLYQSSGDIQKDKRLVELLRKWNSR